MQPPVRLLREGNASDRERNADESRQIRQRPAESMSLGRIFRFREGMALSIRMNFQNIFYSTQLSNPTATNPLVAMTCTGGQWPGLRESSDGWQAHRRLWVR
jgi:hypothetical protein